MGSINLNDTWMKPSPSYKIPNITLHDPANRKMRVITIGAGYSGIMMAYKISQECHNVEHVIYEKNAEIGGTWFENRFPGCACDNPSHAYTFPFAPNPSWPRFLATSADILAYLEKVTTRLDLKKYIKLNHQVSSCIWDDEKGKWKVRVQIVVPKKDWSSQEPLQVVSEFDDEADVLLCMIGPLNRWTLPSIEGLGSFKGRVVHTAGWPEEYGEKQWRGERVVVLGSGSSAVQTVPTMQPRVKHMDVFIRTGIWFVEFLGNSGTNMEYSEEEREIYQRNPDKLMEYIKSLEIEFNGRYDHVFLDSPQQAGMRKMLENRMREKIKDKRLLNGILPDFPAGCRRVSPGDPFMEAIQKANVDVHFTHATRITPDGVIGADGVERKCDTIVCATGFDMTYRPRFQIIGKNGINLHDKWNRHAEAYFGVACADMPNWLTMIGPNWPVGTGSLQCGIDSNASYIIQCIKKIQNENLKSFTPKQSASDAFNQHTQTWAKDVVFGKGCSTGLVDAETGRLRLGYPGSSRHYREMLETVRWEDMDIEYVNKENMFAFMGIGRHLSQTEEGRKMGAELTPWCDLSKVDKRMLEEDGKEKS